MNNNTINVDKYGFTYGGATVRRLFDDPEFGVCMEVTTKRKNRLQIRVTPSGIIRIVLDEKKDNHFRA